MKNFTINAIFSALLGAVIWFLSPFITGEVEPWDAFPPVFYLVSLFIVGFIAAIPKSASLNSIYFGVIVGQFVYMLVFLPIGPLILVSVLTLAIYSLLTLIGPLVKRRDIN
ncbi:hypothetical protein Q4561_11720 [Alteromonas sp. 1_MG-2023]|uniref:hypothetical protein n=1 Tax=Alteromonas sp. 1_MG-2023 TaxID=3062669 RepID=UPI0026E218C0|nr:hypothetical protein [Alteromonas sp. 1_MG-2023]MDO6567728.1 hypothetical protein [Alteromonas sp. 1_MG-2023]